MAGFAYRGDGLYAEDVSLAAVAEAVGTPFYCYSKDALQGAYERLVAAFGAPAPLIAYSVKASPNLALIAILAKAGAGADVVSGGELKRALAAGVAPGKIVFSGVGKTRDEMRLALEAGILQFNVESEGELFALDEVARAMGAQAPIAFRVNPDVKAGGHDKISTGKAEDKFGVPIAEAPGLYAKAARLAAISVEGVDLHIGSQISDLQPFRAAFTRLADLTKALRAAGHHLVRADIGGGLGVSYGDGADPPTTDDYARLVRETVGPLGLDLVIEPGRLIAAAAGVLVSRVLYVKENASRRFLVLDAGMNDFLRPALYDAHHAILPVRPPPEGSAGAVYDVVGPVCESADRFARGREMPQITPGDLVAILDAGAYGASLSCDYNTRPLVPEVLVSGERFAVIRRRPTFEEMVALEKPAPWR